MQDSNGPDKLLTYRYHTERRIAVNTTAALDRGHGRTLGPGIINAELAVVQTRNRDLFGWVELRDPFIWDAIGAVDLIVAEFGIDVGADVLPNNVAIGVYLEEAAVGAFCDERVSVWQALG